ncbi:MAG: ATP-binding protein [Chloroflexota bacterium]|nr:ATP-binding protein [Chloroflexota bacterium]
MLQARHQLTLTVRNHWKHYLIDAALALLTAVPMIIFVLPFHMPVSQTSALFLYLFIIFLLIYKRRTGIAILIAFTACAVVDFFLIQPIFSFSISHLEEGLNLLLFLLLALAVSYLNSRSQKQADKAIQHEHDTSVFFEDRLRRQTEETNLREYELRIFSEVVREIREEKDLRRQLSSIAQAIDSAFSTSGIQGCIFLLPDLEGISLQPMIATQSAHSCSLSREEETSARWVIQYGQSVEIRATATFKSNRGIYARWVAKSCSVEDPSPYGSSYIFPLLSQSRVIGGVRLLIKDSTDPRFLSIKKGLERNIHGLPDPRSDLFLEFLNYAASLIEQTLIERALRGHEEVQMELRQRSEDLYTSIISSVSHELKTPLTLIKGAASSMLKQGEAWNDETVCHGFLTDILSEAEGLEHIINGMFAVSRIEQGKLKLDRELYPIETIVFDTLELKHIQTLLHGRPIKKCGFEDLPLVDVDPTMIGRVLVNLLENAARYTPAGSPIEMHGQAAGNQVILSVIDHGPGIPLIEQERIFEKFYQIPPRMEETGPFSTPSVPSVQGTGLGLAICRGFVEAHNGRIWVENLDAGGAKFQFTLPLRQRRDKT